jgi:EAL domain-containing protein (putative c-di-GMP-specific phosphodiesterase class I)
LFDSQLRHDRLTSIVTSALDEHVLPPNALELEITENVFLQRDKLMIRPLRRLRELGVGVAFDDCGTGYASLSLLKGFPLSRLKIDQSFVRDLCTNSEDAAGQDHYLSCPQFRLGRDG